MSNSNTQKVFDSLEKRNFTDQIISEIKDFDVVETIINKAKEDINSILVNKTPVNQTIGNNTELANIVANKDLSTIDPILTKSFDDVISSQFTDTNSNNINIFANYLPRRKVKEMLFSKFNIDDDECINEVYSLAFNNKWKEIDLEQWLKDVNNINKIMQTIKSSTNIKDKELAEKKKVLMKQEDSQISTNLKTNNEIENKQQSIVNEKEKNNNQNLNKLIEVKLKNESQIKTPDDVIITPVKTHVVPMQTQVPSTQPKPVVAKKQQDEVKEFDEKPVTQKLITKHNMADESDSPNCVNFAFNKDHFNLFKNHDNRILEFKIDNLKNEMKSVYIEEQFRQAQIDLQTEKLKNHIDSRFNELNNNKNNNIKNNFYPSNYCNKDWNRKPFKNNNIHYGKENHDENLNLFDLDKKINTNIDNYFAKYNLENKISESIQTNIEGKFKKLEEQISLMDTNYKTILSPIVNEVEKISENKDNIDRVLYNHNKLLDEKLEFAFNDIAKQNDLLKQSLNDEFSSLKSKIDNSIIGIESNILSFETTLNEFESESKKHYELIELENLKLKNALSSMNEGLDLANKNVSVLSNELLNLKKLINDKETDLFSNSEIDEKTLNNLCIEIALTNSKIEEYEKSLNELKELIRDNSNAVINNENKDLINAFVLDKEEINSKLIETNLEIYKLRNEIDILVEKISNDLSKNEALENHEVAHEETQTNNLDENIVSEQNSLEDSSLKKQVELIHENDIENSEDIELNLENIISNDIVDSDYQDLNFNNLNSEESFSFSNKDEEIVELPNQDLTTEIIEEESSYLQNKENDISREEDKDNINEPHVIDFTDLEFDVDNFVDSDQYVENNEDYSNPLPYFTQDVENKEINTLDKTNYDFNSFLQDIKNDNNSLYVSEFQDDSKFDKLVDFETSKSDIAINKEISNDIGNEKQSFDLFLKQLNNSDDNFVEKTFVDDSKFDQIKNQPTKEKEIVYVQQEHQQTKEDEKYPDFDEINSLIKNSIEQLKSLNDIVDSNDYEQHSQINESINMFESLKENK